MALSQPTAHLLITGNFAIPMDVFPPVNKTESGQVRPELLCPS
jgi:hypothetical protein